MSPGEIDILKPLFGKTLRDRRDKIFANGLRNRQPARFLLTKHLPYVRAGVNIPLVQTRRIKRDRSKAFSVTFI
jgi:hypothetical protein